ncbi:MAG: cytochrome-c oxidase, cbb3-type subunit II [Candidatus Palauibacterales bacterium]|jgi:cytochrome c oxidase cbb3-type subunit I/II|nr:cytochrome-c oxidase, cbb3-type subunit II [Candidatus Palauibacterales bacterium]MDP2482558.1 cytochrome-c oxidase, cbb3-type subunit II [Candidatus Palauibacterales bacterium]
MADETKHHGSEKKYGQFHRRVFEANAVNFAVWATIAILIGGIVEIVPMFTPAGPEISPDVTPYTALEVAGRDIYVSEGCYLCHSQWVRPMRAEILRYGPWSRAWEYQYDRPFQLGSRRIGPDLHRVGNKYPDAWHYEHMRDPRSTSPGSIMPSYAWLLTKRIDPADVEASMVALRKTGTPYSDEEIASVEQSLAAQGGEIVGRLQVAGIESEPDRAIVALIAYLQRLGVDGRAALQKRGVEY